MASCASVRGRRGRCSCADFTGSKSLCGISHAGHSNVRHSPPLWFGEIRASHISEPHRRHRGRSIVVVFVGFNRVSGMGPFCNAVSYRRSMRILRAENADIHCQKTIDGEILSHFNPCGFPAWTARQLVRSIPTKSGTLTRTTRWPARFTTQTRGRRQ